MMQRLSGGLYRTFIESSATFKKHTPEKLAFVFLGLVDLVLTIIALNCGFYEINPLMRLLFHLPVILLLVKIFIPVFLAWLIPGKLLLPSIALLAFIVAWNTIQMAAYLA